MKSNVIDLVRKADRFDESYFEALRDAEQQDREPEPETEVPDDELQITERDADLANAILTVSATFATSVRFDHTRRQWHILNAAGHWAPDRTEQIHELLETATRQAMALPGLDKSEIIALTKLLDRHKALQVLATLTHRSPIGMEGNEFDREPYLLGVKNGVVDLRDGMLRPGRPEDMVSRSTGLAFDRSAECPRFEAFLAEIMSGDFDRITFLRRWLGYGLLGFTREQKFALWVGTGQNGKGVLKRIVRHVVGDYGLELPSTLYMRTKGGSARADAPRPELVELQGVRIALGSEPEGGQLNDELIKAHSGEDEIRARRLYANQMLRFYPSHQINLLTNLAPAVEDVGTAMRRRLLLIPFEETFAGPREDLNLYDRLREESEGILALLVNEAVAYLESGLGPIPARVEMAGDEFLAENNPLSGWLDDRVIRESTASTAFQDLYLDYQDWLEGQPAMTRTAFGLKLGSLGFPTGRAGGKGHQQVVRRGLRLRGITDA